MAKTRKTDLAKNTGVLAIGTLLPRVATFVTLPVLTAFLTKEEYGSYDLILTIVSLLLPAATLQLQLAAFRFLIDDRGDFEKSKAVISSSFAFIVPVSLIVLIIYYIATDILLPGGLRWDVRLLACCYYFVNILSNETLQCMRGLGHNEYYSLSCMLSAAVQLILTVLLVAVFQLGLFGAVLVMLVASFVALVYQIAIVRLHEYIDVHSVDGALIREMLAYSWPLVPNNLSGWVMRLSNRLVITFFMGVAANAAFAIAYKIPMVVALAQNTFTMAWQENASIAMQDADARNYFSEVFDTVLRLATGFTSVVIAATPFVFAILVQGEYADAYNQVPVLMFSMYWVWIATFFSGIYVAHKKTVNNGVSMTVAAALNLLIDVVAVPHIGLYGASVAYLISYMALSFFRMVDTSRFCRIYYGLGKLFGFAAVLAMQCIVLSQANIGFDIANAFFGCIFAYCTNRKMVHAMIRAIRAKATRRFIKKGECDGESE